jgi:hypothetical protein
MQASKGVAHAAMMNGKETAVLGDKGASPVYACSLHAYTNMRSRYRP